jgi:hypothetical protein
VGVETYYASKGFVSRLPKDLPPIFQENAMDGATPVIDGLPSEGASRAPSTAQESRADPSPARSFAREGASRATSLPQDTVDNAPAISGQPCEEASQASLPQQSDHMCALFQVCGIQNLLCPSPRHSSSILSGASQENQRSTTPADAKQRFTLNKEDRSSLGGTLVAGEDSEVNTPRGAEILPSSQSTPYRFLGNRTPNPFSPRISVVKIAKYFKAAEQPGIFGVPLRESIGYANVAISLIDGDGKSYIYGYVPIVVAKCGVYLKEKGTC